MQTETYMIWQEGNGVLKPRQDFVCGEAGNANCAPARQLKNVLVDLAWDAVVHQVKPALDD